MIQSETIHLTCRWPLMDIAVLNNNHELQPYNFFSNRALVLPQYTWKLVIKLLWMEQQEKQQRCMVQFGQD